MRGSSSASQLLLVSPRLTPPWGPPTRHPWLAVPNILYRVFCTAAAPAPGLAQSMCSLSGGFTGPLGPVLRFPQKLETGTVA